MSKIDTNRPFLPVRIAVMTVSDSRTLETDTSGAALVARVEAAGHTVAARTIVSDDADLIAAQLSAGLQTRWWMWSSPMVAPV